MRVSRSLVTSLSKRVLVGDPQPREQRGVGQPAAAAGHRRCEEGAARGEAVRGQPAGPLVEDRVDRRRELRVLQRGAPVALDVGEDDVLAAQRRQQVGARGAAECVRGRLFVEDLLVPQARGHLLGGLDGHRGGAPRRDRHGRDDLRAERETPEPGRGEHGDGPDRGRAAPGGEIGQAAHGQCQEDDEDGGTGHRADRGAQRAGPPQRALEQRHDAGQLRPVEERVERPGEDLDEAHLQDVEQGQEAQHRPGDDRDHPARPRWQDEQERDTDQRLHRDPQQREWRDLRDLPGRDERDEHQHTG